MNELRENLLDRMIRIYGFEHPLVIQFAEMCQAYTSPELSPLWDGCLRTLVESHERAPYFPEE
jgi:hypothetical protein